MNADGRVERRDERSDLGGTMRLGAQPADIVPGTLVHRVYKSDVVNERHRHRYEVNNHYLPRSRRRASRWRRERRPNHSAR